MTIKDLIESIEKSENAKELLSNFRRVAIERSPDITTADVEVSTQSKIQQTSISRIERLPAVEQGILFEETAKMAVEVHGSDLERTSMLSLRTLLGPWYSMLVLCELVENQFAARSGSDSTNRIGRLTREPFAWLPQLQLCQAVVADRGARTALKICTVFRENGWSKTWSEDVLYEQLRDYLSVHGSTVHTSGYLARFFRSSEGCGEGNNAVSQAIDIGGVTHGRLQTLFLSDQGKQGNDRAFLGMLRDNRVKKEETLGLAHFMEGIEDGQRSGVSAHMFLVFNDPAGVSVLLPGRDSSFVSGLQQSLMRLCSLQLIGGLRKQQEQTEELRAVEQGRVERLKQVTTKVIGVVESMVALDREIKSITKADSTIEQFRRWVRDCAPLQRDELFYELPKVLKGSHDRWDEQHVAACLWLLLESEQLSGFVSETSQMNEYWEHVAHRRKSRLPDGFYWTLFGLRLPMVSSDALDPRALNENAMFSMSKRWRESWLEAVRDETGSVELTALHLLLATQAAKDVLDGGEKMSKAWDVHTGVVVRLPEPLGDAVLDTIVSLPGVMRRERLAINANDDRWSQVSIDWDKAGRELAVEWKGWMAQGAPLEAPQLLADSVAKCLREPGDGATRRFGGELATLLTGSLAAQQDDAGAREVLVDPARDGAGSGDPPGPERGDEDSADPTEMAGHDGRPQDSSPSQITVRTASADGTYSFSSFVGEFDLSRLQISGEVIRIAISCVSDLGGDAS
jgi:hypothetical protein